MCRSKACDCKEAAAMPRLYLKVRSGTSMGSPAFGRKPVMDSVHLFSYEGSRDLSIGIDNIKGTYMATRAPSNSPVSSLSSSIEI
jgi:hypothetical protein